jgi:hypothetical protein
MNRKYTFVGCLFIGLLFLCHPLDSFASSKKKTGTGIADREYTIRLLGKIADPVLIPLSQELLYKSIPRKEWETDEANIQTSPLQAFGRTLSGIAPWLSLGSDNSKEGLLRAKYIDLCIKGLAHSTDPNSADYMFAKPTQQIIVHLAFLAYPMLIAPKQLWEPLTPQQKENAIRALKIHRNFVPAENNWLLFSSVIECALWKFSGECNLKPIEYGVNRHLKWFLGDGTYGDGPNLHWDYYNSYVIHPLLLETLKICKEMGNPLAENLPECLKRGQRYAEILEHLISPEGTFPVIGRSSTYRIAVLQQLEYMAFRWNMLPPSLDPGATRAAITAVIRRMMEAPGTFDKNGWLNAGLVGEQINARDSYNFTGALYMCAMGFIHLGIPATDPFWTNPAAKWTQQKIWDGDDIPGQAVFK